MKIKVVLADDHVIVRNGLKIIIETLDKDIKVVGEVSNGEELVRYAAAHDKEVDVYIVDISMPVLNGIEATAKIIKMNPHAKVVILSMFDDRPSVEKALKAGAVGYVVKVAVADEIVTALHQVMENKYYLCEHVSKYIVECFVNKTPNISRNNGKKLTNKEREILQLVAEGYSSKQIAKHFCLSLNTIHVHRNNIMRKLNIHKQADLVRFALKEGIAQL